MYIEIIDSGECFSTTMEFVNGVYANKTEWDKHNFYPQNGMVGEVVKITPRAYIIKIMEGIYVPMTKNGIREITFAEYNSRKDNNTCTGMNERQTKINNNIDNLIGYSWRHLPNLREYFKQDIVNNVTKLTCDFEVKIFLPDLEQSCVIYATDMILEYKEKWGSSLPPYVIPEISEQVIDVYQQFFADVFFEDSVERCKMQIEALVNSTNARKQIDDYYNKINMRYSWH